jgi:hypothetical protein
MRLPLVDPENVVKTIHRIRQRLAATLFPKGDGAHYVKRLLETTNLGYRLSTNPENLHLVILGDPAPGQEESG